MDEKTKTAQTSSNVSASMLNSKDDKSAKEEHGKDGRSEIENIGGEKTGKDASIPANKGVEETKETSAASDTAKDNSALTIGGVASGDKRPREASEDDASEEALKKKSKKEDILTGGSSAGLASTKPIRGTRGSLSEKIIGDKGNKKGGKRGSPASSITNSPSKPSSRDHSDEEDAEARQKAAATSNTTFSSVVSSVASSATSTTTFTTSSTSQPKVPPLKIVLSGQNGNSGSSSVMDDKKSPSGNKDDSKEVDKPALSKDTSAAVAGSAMSASGEMADNSNTNQSVVSDGLDDSDSKGASGNGSSHGSNHGTRLTRSRANQGTPGPNDQGNDSPRESTGLNQCENANLEAPTNKEVVATNSNIASQSNSQSSSSHMNYADYNVKKRKLRSQVEDSMAGNGNMAPSASTSASGTGEGSRSGGGGGGGGGGGQGKSGCSSTSNNPTASNEPLNDIEKYLNIRKQVEQRRKNLFPVQPKPPNDFKNYLMNRKTYLLRGNAPERLQSIPMIQPPPSLSDGPLRDLFKQQEEERYKLRQKHVVEKEKLVLAKEQEILRVHGRAARALANQSLPYSVCTILRDEEIYTLIDPQQEEKNRDIRSRYNGRLFLSWLQDVDDKWEKIKEQMVLRHHNEAESLNAVQKMDWEWKVNEITGGTGAEGVLKVDDLHIPMVHVSDESDL